MDRVCANCGTDISTKRSDAKTCSLRCRVAKCRKQLAAKCDGKRYTGNDVTLPGVKKPRPARVDGNGSSFSLRERMMAVTAFTADGAVTALRQEKEALRAENKRLRTAQGRQHKLAAQIQHERKLRLAAEAAFERLAASLGRGDVRPFLAAAGL